MFIYFGIRKAEVLEILQDRRILIDVIKAHHGTLYGTLYPLPLKGKDEPEQLSGIQAFVTASTYALQTSAFRAKTATAASASGKEEKVYPRDSSSSS